MKKENMNKKQKKIDNLMRNLGKKYPIVLTFWEEQKNNIEDNNFVVATYKTIREIWN